jgi:hypothetical protein
VDPIRQEPVIDHQEHVDAEAKEGTLLRIYWCE